MCAHCRSNQPLTFMSGRHAGVYTAAANRRDQAFSLFPSFDDPPRHRANQEATA